jgi:hypothetical protein
MLRESIEAARSSSDLFIIYLFIIYLFIIVLLFRRSRMPRITRRDQVNIARRVDSPYLRAAFFVRSNIGRARFALGSRSIRAGFTGFSKNRTATR